MKDHEEYQYLDLIRNICETGDKVMDRCAAAAPECGIHGNVDTDLRGLTYLLPLAMLYCTSMIESVPTFNFCRFRNVSHRL